MRIIGGQYKSRLIAVPRGVDMRPTQDKVRQAIFNMLCDINGKRVLELFAGSGAFGIEAISRGASYVAFVDNNPKCVETIRNNLDSLGVNIIYYTIIRSNAESVPARLRNCDEKFDLVFIDPPYHAGIAKKSLINLTSCDILAPGSLVVIEHFKKDAIVAISGLFTLEKERRYGDTVITMLRKVSDGIGHSDHTY